jgi:hypothetical protein
MASRWRMIGIVLLVLGLLGAIYGHFTYTKETHDAKIGPVHLSVKDKETVHIPTWAGALVAVVGAALIVIPTKGRGA